MATPRQYWATKTTDDLGPEIERLIQAWNMYLLTSGRWDLWRRVSRLTYGQDPDSGRETTRVTLSGVEGEIVQVRANLLMRYMRAFHTLVTGSRPSFEARATADDSSATETVAIGNAILEYSLAQRKAEEHWRRACWYALQFAEGWLRVRWDELAGRPLMADPQGGMKFEGDVSIDALRPDCVVRDVSADDMTNLDWVIVATQRSRWELASELPEWAVFLSEATSKTQLDDQRTMCFRPEDAARERGQDDLVTVYELYHRATSVLPEGRYAMWVAGKVIRDDVNPYSEIPVYPNIPNRIPGAPLGYSHMWDLLGLQQVSDSMLTALVTTVENYAIPTIWRPPGVDNGSPIMMASGCRLITSTQPPEQLELMGTAPAQIQQAMDFVGQLMTMSTGLNDAALGDAGKSQSGAALAMQHSLAVQSSSGEQATAQASFSQMGNGILKRFKAFSSEERVISIAGKGKRGMCARFTRDRLATLDGVDVNVGSPMTQSAAGRKEIIGQIFDRKAITPQQYLDGLATGRLDPVTDAPLNHRVLIESENERLRKGEPVKALATDNHVSHIQEHKSVLDDPDIRLDDRIAGAALQHIQEHVMLWSQIAQASPDLLAATGQRMPPSLLMAQAAMAAQAQRPPTNSGEDEQMEAEEPNEEPEGEMSMSAAPDMPTQEAGGGITPAAGAESLPDMPQVPMQ